MTGEQLKAAATALYGDGWGSAILSDDLGVAKRSVERWLAGAPIPDGVDEAMHRLLRDRMEAIRAFFSGAGPGAA